MKSRTLIALFVILVVVIASALIWGHYHRTKTSQTSILPVLSVTASNQTKNSNAASVTAKPNDEIIFTLTAENQTDKIISGYVLEANIADLSSHSTLVDADGGSYNSATNSLVWTPLDIAPNQSIEKTIKVRVNSLATGSNGELLKMQFGNELTIGVANQTAAITPNSGIIAGAQNDYQAPTTGASENFILLLAGLSTIGLWLVRRRKTVKVKI